MTTKPVIRVNFLKLRLMHHLNTNNISIDVWFGQYWIIWNLKVQKNLNIEKIAFKVVQMKFLAMHITKQNIFTVLNTVKYIYGTKYLHGT